MNNKAFTVVELLASFTLTMIIVVFLFEIVLELKDVYQNDAIKTKVLTQNALIATALDQKLNTIYTAQCETDTCTVNDDYDINIDETEKDGSKIYKIKIDDQAFSMPKNVTITTDDEYLFSSASVPDTMYTNNSYIKIAYIVESNYLKEPIKFTYVRSYIEPTI